MKPYLIVIDMQNDFIDGALGTPEAQAMLPRAVERIRGFRDGAVIATMDTHEADYLDTAEGQKLPVVHCVRGTEGWQIAPAVKEALGADCVIVEKPTFGSVRLPGLVDLRSVRPRSGRCRPPGPETRWHPVRPGP